MGVVADAVLAAGGQAHGVIPTSLIALEVEHRGLTRLDEVGSMHERKARMAELSDGFIALPGGAGTLEEIAEIWTWAQLGFHAKPIGFLNVAGYFDQLFGFIDHAVAEAFIKPVHAQLLIRNPRPGPLVDALAAYVRRRPRRRSGSGGTRPDMPAAAPTAFLNARLVDPESGYDGPGCLIVAEGVVADIIHEAGLRGPVATTSAVIDCDGAMLAPGLIDLRVKTGEPGAEPKETLKSAARAAAAGGVTSIVVQPDTDPVVDEPSVVDFILRRARDIEPGAGLSGRRGDQGAGRRRPWPRSA